MELCSLIVSNITPFTPTLAKNHENNTHHHHSNILQTFSIIKQQNYILLDLKNTLSVSLLFSIFVV